MVRRLTGGVVLIALFSFAAQAVVLGLWLQPVADDVAGIAAEQALIAQAVLRSVPADQRPALAAKLSAGQVRVTAQRPPMGKAITALPAPREYELRARERVGPDIQVRFEPRPDDSFAAVFRLPVGDQVWWLTREYGAASGAVSGTLGVWLLLLAGATVGALLVSVRFIARPIGQLAEQMNRQKGSLRPLPERADASVELQALVRAFNQLAQQVTEAGLARQQLLAGVSHDLRTPLARLRLRVETQCEPEMADALTADLLALERIVDQFLAYVQGGSEVALGEPEPLHQTVRDTLRRYEGSGQAVAARIDRVDMPVPDLAVQRLLNNLVDNAFAYGTAPVQVELQRGPDGAELRVCDHGPGMSQAEFERAQQPFVRLTRNQSEIGHCGLGLAIVAQIARQLGGRLQAVHDAQGRFGISLHLPGT
jgi:two-component system osmolarity sensor histidine kinase EnvZ